MEKLKIESGSAVEALPKLVELLAELPALEREKAICAAKILLGDVPSSTTAQTQQQSHVQTDGESNDGVAAKAVHWMRKNNLSRVQLDQVFSIEDNTFDVIAAKMPGKSKRLQTME